MAGELAGRPANWLEAVPSNNLASRSARAAARTLWERASFFANSIVAVGSFSVA